MGETTILAIIFVSGLCFLAVTAVQVLTGPLFYRWLMPEWLCARTEYKVPPGLAKRRGWRVAALRRNRNGVVLTCLVSYTDNGVLVRSMFSANPFLQYLLPSHDTIFIGWARLLAARSVHRPWYALSLGKTPWLEFDVAGQSICILLHRDILEGLKGSNVFASSRRRDM